MARLPTTCCAADGRLGEPNRPRMQPRRESPEVTLAPPVGGSDLEIARKLGLRVAAARDPSVWQLVAGPLGWTLRAPESLGAMALELGASRGALAQRLRSARRTDPLPRSLGLHRAAVAPTVVDATAGLCRDSMVLAGMGCVVTALERVPALALLAMDAVRNAGLADRLQVLATDAVAWLDALPTPARPAIVYLDPMFGEAGKAQVKKDMQVCRALAGPPDDPTALFAAARAAARERVVVKRHPDEAELAPGVSFQVAGERVRFDVYLQPGAGA